MAKIRGEAPQASHRNAQAKDNGCWNVEEQILSLKGNVMRRIVQQSQKSELSQEKAAKHHIVNGLHSQFVVSLQKQTSARVVRNMFLHPHADAKKELLVKPSCVDKTCPGACRTARKWAWADLATPPQKGKRANQDHSPFHALIPACLIQGQWQMSDHAPGVCTSLRMDRKHCCQYSIQESTS